MDVKQSYLITENVPLIANRPFRVHYRQKVILQNGIDKIVEHGGCYVIFFSMVCTGCTNYQLLVSTVKVRMCIDHKGLETVTKRDYYPLPNLQTSVDQLGNANLHSGFDFTPTYHQIDMGESDKQKTML